MRRMFWFRGILFEPVRSKASQEFGIEQFKVLSETISMFNGSDLKYQRDWCLNKRELLNNCRQLGYTRRKTNLSNCIMLKSNRRSLGNILKPFHYLRVIKGSSSIKWTIKPTERVISFYFVFWASKTMKLKSSKEKVHFVISDFKIKQISKLSLEIVRWLNKIFETSTQFSSFLNQDILF